jgi:Concanavalin A-like lectin/glucanases superfamily
LIPWEATVKRIASVLTVLALALLALAQAAQASPAQSRTATRTVAKSGAGAVSRSGAVTPATDLPSNSNTSATSDENLSVDLGATQGSFGHGADGSLYGLYDQGVPSDDLIQGMGLQTTDTKAQDGQQHPGSDALEIAQPFASSGGSDIYIYMTDVYRNFPYERTSYAQYQGYLRTEVKQDLTSPYRNRIVLVPYNEPDGNWFAGLQDNAAALTAFESEWQQTYQLIKGLWPAARIAGPNFFQYQGQALTSFLAYCQQNHCLPNIITWHELNNPSTIAPDVAAFRAAEAPLGLNLPVSLDEYAARYQLTSPGRMVQWLSAINGAKVSGDLPYWNENGTLSDSTSQQNIPNAQWWLYNWYSSLNGQSVQVTPPQANTDNTLQAVAALNTAQRQARIILGGGPPGQADVTVKHVNPAVFGHTVHATVLQDGWSGMTGAAAAPTRIADSDVPVSANGSVNLPVDITGPPGGSGCDATGARVPGKIGNAVALCGNDEYVSLPSGIVSGLHDFTVSAWVNPSVDTAWQRIFDFGTGTNDYMFLTLNNGSGQLRFAITDSGAGGEQQINGTGTLPLNTWSQVTVTMSGSTGTLYVDGKAIGTNTAMTLDPADLGVTNQNWLGRSEYPADPYFSGDLDDVGIYSTALSASQVAALAGGQAAAGDVADYSFDETSGATALDSSGNGHNATIISDPQAPTSMDAYEIILSPGGTGSGTPADGTSPLSYAAADATMTGTGWNINTEGTPSNLGGFATYADQDVGGLRTGSSTVITFNVNVPQTGDYLMRVFDGSDAQASDVSGPTNIFARVDGGPPTEIWLPDAYNWVIWNYGTAQLHLTAGAHTISLSTVGANGAVTTGDAIIDKIDLTPQSASGAVIYEAEQAQLANGARANYARQGQSGAGAADIARGQDVTFWVYSASDGYSDLAFRSRGQGAAGVSVNGLPLSGDLPTGDGRSWSTPTDRVYLSAGINKVVVTGRGGAVTLDKLTVTSVTGGSSGATGARTYQAEDGALAGTAKVATGYSQANGSVVTGVGGGAANSLTFTVQAPAAGTYGMTVRYANNQGIIANHYNPDLMTAPADISVNGGPTFHVNFANTFDWNQFWNLTVPVRLHAGANTIKFIANPQYNWDSTTIGYIYSGSDVGDPLRSQTAPNIDQITLAPFQAKATGTMP